MPCPDKGMVLLSPQAAQNLYDTLRYVIPELRNEVRDWKASSDAWHATWVRDSIKYTYAKDLLENTTNLVIAQQTRLVKMKEIRLGQLNTKLVKAQTGEKILGGIALLFGLGFIVK